MGWIDKLQTDINNSFNKARAPLAELPAILAFCEANNRPGLSAISLATEIISRLPEMGINTGVNNDGSKNKVLQFVKIISESVVKEIKNNMKVNIPLVTGLIDFAGVGASASGTVAVTGRNVSNKTVAGLPQ